MIWVIIMALAVLLDQISKIMIRANMKIGDSVTIIDKFFYLTYWENRGAAWGIMQNSRYILIPITLLVSVGVAYFLFKAQGRVLRTALSLILGGAAGNLIDRIFRGSVTDFIEFLFGSYHYPIFNIADSCVVVGTIILGYYLLFIYKEKAKE